MSRWFHTISLFWRFVFAFHGPWGAFMCFFVFMACRTAIAWLSYSHWRVGEGAMAPIESLKLPKAARTTPPAIGRKGFLSHLDFCLQMETQWMHLNRFRVAVEKSPKTFQLLIDYRRQIFEQVETPEPAEPEVPDLDQIDFKEAMITIPPSRRCTFLSSRRSIRSVVQLWLGIFRRNREAGKKAAKRQICRSEGALACSGNGLGKQRIWWEMFELSCLEWLWSASKAQNPVLPLIQKLDKAWEL